MNSISNGIHQADWSRTQTSKPAGRPTEEPASNPSWGSDRVELSSAALDGAMNNTWKDVWEIRGGAGGSRLVCTDKAPVLRPGEVPFATGQSVGPAGSPICR